MITMDQYEFIRIAHRVYGKSIRAIERETGHDRKTIRKVLKGEHAGYSPRHAQLYPSLGAYLGIIESWLEADKAAPKNQRHTAARVFRRLVNEEGFKGSESAVRRYVRKAKVRLGVNAPKAFIPLDPDCGQEAEVDWGGALAVIAGEQLRLKFFCMRSKFSGKPFVRFYPCERQQAFFDAHIHAFAFFGGVFKTLVYDNLTTAVQKVLRGKGRIEQESFRKFHSYYNFYPRFCNVASAHEKGGVEGNIGYARRNYMVPIPRAQSIEELNDKLTGECLAYGNHRIQGRERTVSELFEEEEEHLIALPDHPFSNIQTVQSRVNHYSTVILDKNRYSVPTDYAGLTVRAVLGVDQVEIFYEGKRVGAHRRLFGNNKWQLDPDHYLDLLQRRPMAFCSARPIRQWRKSWSQSLEMLLKRFIESRGETDGTREFISVLMLYRHHKKEDVNEAVERGLECNVSSRAGVEHLLLHCANTPGFEPLSSWQKTIIPDISVYAELGGVQ
jgi:transposase